MSVLPGISRQAFLEWLWLTSLALVLASLGVLLVLVVRRLMDEHRQQRSQAQKAMLMPYFYAALHDAAVIDSATLPRLQRSGDSEIVCMIALDMLRALRGDDAERIMHLLQIWEVLPWLEHTARYGRRGKRIQAITLLGYYSDMPSLAVLLDQADAKDMYIQMAALRGLARRNTVLYLETFTEHLVRAGQTNTVMLADIFRQFGEAAVPWLMELAESDAIPDVRCAVIQVLGYHTGTASVLALLMHLTTDADADVRMYALNALGRSANEQAAPAVLKCLQDDVILVRARAAKALAAMQTREVYPALMAALQDEAWEVRFQAARSMHQLGSKGRVLLQAVAQQTDGAGQIAQQTLAELGA